MCFLCCSHISITKQRLSKHVPANTQQMRISTAKQRMFSVLWSDPRLYNERPTTDVHSSVEAGSNTSTVALRVVGGDKKGSLESEAVKCGSESHGTRTGE
jgi:hypothetical protein